MDLFCPSKRLESIIEMTICSFDSNPSSTCQEENQFYFQFFFLEINYIEK